MFTPSRACGLRVLLLWVFVVCNYIAPFVIVVVMLMVAAHVDAQVLSAIFCLLDSVISVLIALVRALWPVTVVFLS